MKMTISRKNENIAKGQTQTKKKKRNKTNEQFFVHFTWLFAVSMMNNTASMCWLRRPNFDLYFIIVMIKRKSRSIRNACHVHNLSLSIFFIVCYRLSLRFVTQIDFNFDWPLNVCTMLLLIICHSWASPTLGVITRCCLDGANIIDRIGPVPEMVMVRICDWINF